MRNLAISTLALFALLFVSPACSESKAGGSALELVQTHMKSIKDSLGKVTDEASAKTANTTITGLVEKISAALKGAKALGGDGLKKITDMIGTEKGGLISKITSLAAPLQKHLAPALEKLKALGS